MKKKVLIYIALSLLLTGCTSPERTIELIEIEGTISTEQKNEHTVQVEDANVVEEGNVPNNIIHAKQMFFQKSNIEAYQLTMLHQVK